MIAYTVCVAAVLLALLTIALDNARLLIRLTPAPTAQPERLVSVLIPARNEAATIAETVTALCAQSYRNLELLVLDDGSTDGTASVAAAAAAGDPLLHLLTGAPLPDGWTGKNWACAQLAAEARGELLIFTDADVTWSPPTVAAVANIQTELDADLLTVWPTQETVTPGERLVVPLMALSLLAYLPLRLAHGSAYPLAAAANGQCMVFRRTAYAAVGGHRAVAGHVVEDVALARRIKAAGLRLRMVDGNGLLRCRMYRHWGAVRSGFSKNILAGHGDSLGLLALSTIGHLALFVGPWVLLVAAWAAPATRGQALIAGALCLLGIVVRGITAASTQQRVIDAIWMPISTLLMTDIALNAIWWRVRYGGPRWKDRTVGRATRRRTTDNQPTGAAHE